MRMWEREAGGEIIWSPDPGSEEAMTAVLCHRVSYDEGAKRQVTDSPPLNGQMTTPPGRRGRKRRKDRGRGEEEKGKVDGVKEVERWLSFDTPFHVILEKVGLM